MQGKPADAAVALVPLIYSLCGQAQGIAAQVALDAARGTATAVCHDARVAREAIREHAWKLLVDWPRQLGLAGDEAAFVRTVKALGAEAKLRAAELRGEPVFTAMLVSLADTGVDAELARRIGQRRDELIALLEGGVSVAGRVAATPLAPGSGQATVATARGELRHEITLAGDAIASYAIVAPTDRLFAADGPLVALLKDEAKVGAGETARRAVMALDPCVPWELEIVDQA